MLGGKTCTKNSSIFNKIVVIKIGLINGREPLFRNVENELAN